MIKPVFNLGLLEDARYIREEVFVREQGFREEFDQLDQSCWNLVLYLDAKPIATARFYPEDPETYHLGRVAVIKPYRGMKVGTYLLKFVETKVKTLGGRKIVLDSQLDKSGFYSKLGYKSPDGEVFLEEGYPHIRMEKSIVKTKKAKKKTA